jgi:protein involved in polysaccharide export with SLBB domain
MKIRPFYVACLSLCLGLSAVRAANPTNSPALPEDSDAYKLTRTDKLYFRIDQDPVPSGPGDSFLVVDSRGMLEVPVSRGYDLRLFVPADGRSLGDVKKDIKQKLEAQYYKTATLTLSLESQSVRPGQVMFYGEIKGPLALIPGQPKYLSDAVVEMKPSEYANLHRVQLIRKTVKTEYDVDEIMKTGKREKDVILENGDIINIKAKIISFQ